MIGDRRPLVGMPHDVRQIKNVAFLFSALEQCYRRATEALHGQGAVCGS
jgi:hypothetical protein